MKHENDILIDITTTSEIEVDVEHIKNTKNQSLFLAFLGVLLFSVCVEIKFNHATLSQYFIHYSDTNETSIFFVFLIASVSNLLASKFLYTEAKNQELNIQKIKRNLVSNVNEIY